MAQQVFSPAPAPAPGSADWQIPPEIEVLLGHVPAALCYIDREQRYRYVNPSFEEWSGVPAEQAIGRPVSEVVGPAMYREVLPHIERALAGHVARYETRVEHHGRTRWLDGILIPDRTPEGEVRGYSLMVRDVSRRKEAEIALDAERERYAAELEREVEERTRELKEVQRRLVQAERLSASEEMAGSVAHAVNNPLQALMGTVEMARQQMMEAPLALERIHHLARRIEGVVEGTLRLVRGGSLELELQPCETLVERLLHEVEPRARRTGIAIDLKLASDLPLMAVDSSLFVSALTGIAENALFVSPPESSISLCVDVLHHGRIVQFQIGDAGPGIPEHVRSRILEPFFTTKGGGTGLGLAIAHGIIQGHRGTLRFDPRPGGGTLVSIEVPAGEGLGRPGSGGLERERR